MSIETELDSARSYEEWASLAQSHDEISGKAKWKRRLDSPLYECDMILDRHEILRSLLQEGDFQGLLFTLNEGFHGNLGGMGNPSLYQVAKFGTKELIRNYVALISESLEKIYQVDDEVISVSEKLDFFRRASHCYGRSALMLSGGAGLIYYHHGVVQSLIDQNVLPHVISGSSAGSVVTAQLGVLSNEELKQGYFSKKLYAIPGVLSPRVISGYHPDIESTDIKEAMLDSIPSDMTFQEAFEHTGRYINITASPAERHQTSRLLNAITSPSVYVRSAVDASCSLPGVVPAVGLYAKGVGGKPKPYLSSRKWTDGSFSEDLPSKRLSRLFGTNHYLVSMINPFAVGFIKDKKPYESKGLRDAAAKVVCGASKYALIRAEKLLAETPGSVVSPLILMVHSILDQDYTGDINFLLETKNFKWKNVLFSYEDDDINALKQAGMRSTWPKIEMIKNATLIADTIDGILEHLDRDRLEISSSGAKEHITLSS